MRALSLFFFTYFAFIGAVNPYFALWLQTEGFNASDIGYLLAIPPAMRLIGPTAWGRLADRTGKRVILLRFMAHVSALGLAMMALAVQIPAQYHAWRFAAIALGLMCMHAMMSGQVPLTESLLLQKISPNIKLYGRVRLFGSLGFIVAVLVLGPLLDWLGTAQLLLLGAALLLAHIAGSWLLEEHHPAAKAININTETTTDKAAAGLFELLALPHVRLFLSSAFLMVFAHMGLYIYLSLYLEAAGYSKTVIGILWAVSAVGEVGYFWIQARLKSSALAGYTRSYWVAAARFAGMAWLAIPLGSPIVLLIGLQVLHTVTFAVHHAASMALVKQLFPANAGSTANALFNTVCYGLAGTVGAVVCATVWQAFGDNTMRAAQAVFSLSSIAAFLGGILAWRLKRGLHR